MCAFMLCNTFPEHKVCLWIIVILACTPDFGNAQQEMSLIKQCKAANMPGLLYSVTQKPDQECEYHAKLTAGAVTALLHAAQCNTDAVTLTRLGRTKHLKNWVGACDESEDANK